MVRSLNKLRAILNYNPSKSPIYRDLTLLIVCFACAIAFLGFPTLQYQSDATPPFKAWLAFAGQFAHMSAQHLGLNLLGLLMLAWGFAPWRTLKKDLFYFTAGFSGVALGLLLHPEVLWYKGLSGALHGLFLGYAAQILICDTRKPVKWVAVVLIIGTIFKLWLELNQPGLLPGVGDNQEPVLHAAHRWGALSGITVGSAWGMFMRLRGAKRKRPT
ncbi:MAG: rhomboid family intramembrane serine protease [Burkholderiales bacterium]|jgi:rhomboid family GlyGly-CTERM serine protease|nr:rhomboid family intramembrane serine protease [Burkholderiales bacterium]